MQHETAPRHPASPTGGLSSDERKPPRRIDAGELFAGLREVIIVHGLTEYRLRHTSNDKLILTK